jgi:cytochrome c-type biogenesis protein CcmH/NrfG
LSAAEQAMFFPKLRRQAKWVFVLLVFVFAGGFVFFGVGSGSTGIGDLLHGNISSIFGGGSSTNSAVSKARDRVRKHPNDAGAWRRLATALRTQRKDAEAITALEHYTRLRPKDSTALADLAGLYQSRLQALYNEANARRDEALAAMPQPYAGLSSNNPVAQLLEGNDQATQLFNQSVTDAFTKLQTVVQKTEDTYKRAVKVKPSDPNLRLQLGQFAENIRDYPVAIASYERYLKLAPDSTYASAVKQRLATLQPAAPAKPKRR